MSQFDKAKEKKGFFSDLFFLKKPFFILAILFFIQFSSGCTDSNNSGNESEIVANTQVDASGNAAKLVEVTNLSQINEALDKGPVVLKLGSKECIPCKEQEQVLSELLPQYRDSASMMLIDVNEYPEFAETFNVVSIPDTSVIVDIEDGKYVYMRPDGSKSSERTSARFIGVTDKETLSETLHKAVASRKAEG
jgi:thioredoxin 1